MTAREDGPRTVEERLDAVEVAAARLGEILEVLERRNETATFFLATAQRVLAGELDGEGASDG